MVKYFTLEYALKIHEEVIKNSGGLDGFSHIGQLDSILQHIQNDTYYPTFIDKLVHLIYATVNSLQKVYHPTLRRLSPLFIQFLVKLTNDYSSGNK